MVSVGTVLSAYLRRNQRCVELTVFQTQKTAQRAEPWLLSIVMTWHYLCTLHNKAQQSEQSTALKDAIMLDVSL